MPDEGRPPAPWCSRDPVLSRIVVSRIASSRRASHHRQISADASATRFNGYAFDACTAPSASTMKAWTASPYDAVGVYVGGVNRACGQPNLASTWVSTVSVQGWRLIPIYVGHQAPCTGRLNAVKFTASSAAADGTANAADAVAKAKALGMLPGTAIYGDMENYSTTDATCRTAVLTFVSAWTKELHRQGYLSGMYANLSLGATQLSDSYNSSTYARPDARSRVGIAVRRSPGGPAFQIRNGQIISAASSTGATTTRRTAVSRSTLTAIASTRP